MKPHNQPSKNRIAKSTFDNSDLSTRSQPTVIQNHLTLAFRKLKAAYKAANAQVEYDSVFAPTIRLFEYAIDARKITIKQDQLSLFREMLLRQLKHEEFMIYGGTIMPGVEDHSESVMNRYLPDLLRYAA